MRISADKRSPYFYKKAHSAKVLIDGKLRKGEVIIADDKEGWAIIYAKDEKGNFVFDGDEIVTKKIYGKIEIIFPPGFEP